ncbi:restriction endonuclease subunit S [Kocuria rhizophila]
MTQNLDYLRIPLNASERADMQGDVPYWGSNGVVGHVSEPLIDEHVVLIGEDGAPFLDPLKPVAFAVNEPIWPNNHIHVLRVLPKGDPKFIAYALNSIDYSLYIKGSTRDKLNQSELSSIEIPVPELSTQQIITDYLDHETAEIDALIADTTALMDTVALRRRSLIDHVFMASEWPEVALKYRGELRSGLTLGRTHDGETRSYPYLRVANVQVGRVKLDEIATINLPIAEAERYRLHEGDVLMTEGGDRDKLGRGAIWGAEIEPMLHQNHVFAFRCGSLLSPEFLVYGLEATPARVYFDQTARQSTNLASTNSTVVKNFRLPMPPLEEQHRVVASLNHELTYMSDMVANAKKVAALARERRAALITAAVTGQIDVTARNKPAAEQLEDDIAQGLHREN